MILFLPQMYWWVLQIKSYFIQCSGIEEETYENERKLVAHIVNSESKGKCQSDQQ